jgi:UrcA family protein
MTMSHVTKDKPPRPRLPSSTLALLLATALAGTIARPASAQLAPQPDSVRITVAAGELDARALAQVRREVAIAARTLCGSGGLAAIYREGTRRCREQISVDAERQLSRMPARLAVAGR